MRHISIMVFEKIWVPANSIRSLRLPLKSTKKKKKKLAALEHQKSVVSVLEAKVPKLGVTEPRPLEMLRQDLCLFELLVA